MAHQEVSIEVFEDLGGKSSRYPVLGTLDIMTDTDLPIALTFQVKDINNLDENTASFSKTFDIPATRNNNEVLQKAYSDKLIDYQKFVGDQIKCRIKVNGLTVLSGSMQVTSSMNRDKIEKYTITVLGDANNWTARFEEPMCQTEWDMDKDTIYDNNTTPGHYTFSSSMWKALNDNVTNCDDHTWCMPHICWGEYSHYQTIGNATRAKMWLEDNVPSIFIKPLVEKYFAEVGYTLKSNFFNSDFFKKLLFPLDWQYFKHGYDQEPIFHIEARFEPPNVTDSMWESQSGNGFQNDEMFGMFMLNPCGDEAMNFDDKYSDFDTGEPESPFRYGNTTNFQNWGSYDLCHGQWDTSDSNANAGGGGYGHLNTAQCSTYVPNDGMNEGFPRWSDGRCAIYFDAANGDRGVPSSSSPNYMLLGIYKFPNALGLSDDNDPDTMRDGTLDGSPIVQQSNRIPFNHTIKDNGKGHYYPYSVSGTNPGYTSPRWAQEALINFQPPFGRGGGGKVSGTWIHPSLNLTLKETCGSFAHGVAFTAYGGNPNYPYFIDKSSYINGQHGYDFPYYHNDAWYGVYNGWAGDNSGSDNPEAELGRDKWMRDVGGNMMPPPVTCRIDKNHEKWDVINLVQGEVELNARKDAGARFFCWSASKAGSYRFNVKIVGMMENKMKYDEKYKPTIRIWKCGINKQNTTDMEQLGKRMLNHKPFYETGSDKMVYVEVDIDTGMVDCDQYDRVWVDIVCGGRFSWKLKNTFIMLSEEFSKRLNSVTATDPFIWDDFCDGETSNNGRIINESFPYDSVEKKYKVPNSHFKVYLDNRVRHMDKFCLRDMLPCDVSKMEFIGGLTGLFNLHWKTDEQSKIVEVEPFDDFYRGKKDAVDWTYKQDFSTEQVTSFMTDKLAKKIKFAYQEDGADEVVDEISKRQSQHWHSHEIELSNRFLNEEIILGTSLFAPTYMFQDFELHYNFGGGQAPWIPLICDSFVEDMGYVTPKPEMGDGFMFRLLSYQGMQSVGMETSYGSWHWNIPHPITGNNGDVSTYPCAVSWHYDLASAPNLSYSLSNNVALGGNAQNGLYHDYWRGMITMLADAPRMKTAFFYLTPSDIAKLDLRNVIHILEHGQANASYWIVSRIVDYQPHMDTPTAVELIQYQIQTSDKGIVAHADDGVTTRYITAGGGSSNGPADQPIINAFSTGTPTGNNTINNTTTTVGIRHDDGSYVQYATPTIMQRGRNNYAPRNRGIAMFGNNLIAARQGQIALGQYNKRDDDAILVVGGGTSNEDRKNIITVSKDGSITFGDKGGGQNMVTTDSNGNYVDMYTEEKKRGGTTVTKVIK